MKTLSMKVMTDYILIKRKLRLILSVGLEGVMVGPLKLTFVILHRES